MRILTRAGETIPLTPKSSEILTLLVVNAGQLVERDELLKEVWPDTFVEEANLSQNIFRLRRALGDERAVPRYIETVTRRGYRFIAPVTTIGADGASGDANGKGAVPKTPVIAVLPFSNTTGDPTLEYLAEGITDNIINNLSRVPALRVMSRSAVFRYKSKDADAQQVGRDLGATAVFVGNLNFLGSRLAVGLELVDTDTGWQLWGASFDFTNTDIFEIQEAITHRLLVALHVRFAGDEQQRVTARYTENAAAYQCYLEGRYHWIRYTRKGIEKAIEHFRRAIELDPNYALAYAGIIDCYLRLATNYLPPEDDYPGVANAREIGTASEKSEDAESRVQLRFEWDWKGAERELRRANELKTDYPAAHQWFAAYRTVKQLYQQSLFPRVHTNSPSFDLRNFSFSEDRPHQIPSVELTLSEQSQVYCAIVREQNDVGNYEAACLVLRPWWSFGDWPKVDGLTPQSCADLLFTVGELASSVASAKQLPRGQKHSEELLNGSIGLFEQLGFRRRAAEARIELAFCYYRQGLFDTARATLMRVLADLSGEDSYVHSLALIRLATLERHAGRLNDALARLTEATAIVQLCGPWATGRCHVELASTYKDLAISEELPEYFAKSHQFYVKALYEFEAVGNHRLTAIVENNLGYLMLALRKLSAAESHLFRAHKTFAIFGDRIRCAQVDDSLAQLYFAQERYDDAEKAIDRAVQVMETGDEDALLAEALTTQGMIYSRLKRTNEAKRILGDAHRLAWRCGNLEGAGRPLLILLEEMWNVLEKEELDNLGKKLQGLLSASQQSLLRERVRRCLNIIADLD
ncbi:MAG TPA: winged helix-turn-helix domain-containing protein [Pyrinomonadaceae bacterium]|nr:winged helix-turn-helix domain-containing protein [Pyrinomonadaceae bacterium]